METAEASINILRELPVGARLHVRSKTDWRSAVVCRFTDERATLSVCSPTGRTYRLHRAAESEIVFDGAIPILRVESAEDWRENFTRYDLRW
ncbi:MAG: hypothetical protein JSS81_11835 [Acidobacteria bacterium]|nr:hypothetical protein [Acidobacteriota bacterium]